MHSRLQLCLCIAKLRHGDLAQKGAAMVVTRLAWHHASRLASASANILPMCCWPGIHRPRRSHSIAWKSGSDRLRLGSTAFATKWYLCMALVLRRTLRTRMRAATRGPRHRPHAEGFTSHRGLLDGSRIEILANPGKRGKLRSESSPTEGLAIHVFSDLLNYRLGDVVL